MKHGLIRGAMSLGGARLLSNVLNAATLLILARLLTPHDFGVVAIVGAILNVVISLTQVSIYQALMQNPAVTRQHIDTAWTLALIRTCLIFGFFLLAAWPLSLIYHEPLMVPVFIVSGLTGAISGLYNPHMNLATKQMRFGPLTIFQICQKVAGLAVAIVLAFMFKSYWAIIIGNFVGAASASLLSYLLIPYRPRFSLQHWRNFLSFSGWIFFSQLCESINWRFDQLVVGIAAPANRMGHYAMADSLAIIPSREIIQPLREVLFPGLSTLAGDMEKLAQATLRAQSTIGLISMPLTVGLALVAEPAVKVVLGEQWTSITSLVQIFAITFAVGSLTSCFPATAMAMGVTRLNFLQQLWTMIVRIPLILFGMVAGGLIGVAIGRFVGDVISNAISLFYMRRLLGVSVGRQLQSHATTVAALVAMSVVVIAATPTTNHYFASDLLRLIVLVCIGGVTFTASSLALWVASGRKGGPVSELIGIAHSFLPARTA